MTKNTKHTPDRCPTCGAIQPDFDAADGWCRRCVAFTYKNPKQCLRDAAPDLLAAAKPIADRATLHPDIVDPDDAIVRFEITGKELNALRAAIAKAKGKAELCRIYGSEIEFSIEVPEERLKNKCHDIWQNFDAYSPYNRDAGDVAYDRFLKFLWIAYPDGRPDERMTDMLKRMGILS
jgi:hypothetical protein